MELEEMDSLIHRNKWAVRLEYLPGEDFETGRWRSILEDEGGFHVGKASAKRPLAALLAAVDNAQTRIVLSSLSRDIPIEAPPPPEKD
jgi:hypothetical protein